MKNLQFRSSARTASQRNTSIGISDPNMVVGYEVPLGCLCVAGEEFENLHFSTAPTSLLTELRVPPFPKEFRPFSIAKELPPFPKATQDTMSSHVMGLD